MANVPAGSLFNHEWRRLSAVAQQVSPLLFGKISNFVVVPMGEAKAREGMRYMRARCVAPGSQLSDTDRCVLLKVTESDWTLMQWSNKPVKILQSRLLHDPICQCPVIDCTTGSSVLVSQVPVQCHEVLSIAELFSGGFMGWSQGAAVMHRLQAPVSVKWGLEKAIDTEPMQRIMQPDMRVVRNSADLKALDPACKTYAMVQGDIRDQWWLPMFQKFPVNTWTVSAPCQPWSFAGRESGLSSEVGKLMLHVADMAAAFEPDLVLFEQVTGFAFHRDSYRVLEAWRAAGFVVEWRATLELADILPCHRSRHLIVFARRSHVQPALRPDKSWGLLPKPTLATAHAVFDLPWSVAKAHIPSPAVLAKYLNPDCMPQSALKAFSCPEAYRIRAPDQSAGCFLAQYSFAHELPGDLLASKGLFGSLVVQGEVTRFFSAAEISSLHGTVLPTLCCQDRRLAMRLLGNCIPVPHAAVTLLKGCQAKGHLLHTSVQDVVMQCLEQRLHAPEFCSATVRCRLGTMQPFPGLRGP